MTNKYTSGPWKINSKVSPDSLKRGIRTISIAGSQKHIADVVAWQKYDYEGVANAKLIIAAPDLLEALENIQHLVDIGAVKIIDKKIPTDIMQKAFNAIKKSRS